MRECVDLLARIDPNVGSSALKADAQALGLRIRFRPDGQRVSRSGGGSIVLAALIPTRPPPDLKTLAMQADTILVAEAERTREQLHRGPSTPALEALVPIFDRLESPADRLLRSAAPRSSYLVLPLFALANAGVAITPDVVGRHEMLVVAILAGLVVGKPLGFVLACALAVGIGLAEKPRAYAWQHVFGAGALAGVGFTMSLFIAGRAFPAAGDFAAAKIAVLAASLVSSLLGIAVLWGGLMKINRKGHI
jgi:NhaA family Na+:H+ antiporter